MARSSRQSSTPPANYKPGDVLYRATSPLTGKLELEEYQFVGDLDGTYFYAWGQDGQKHMRLYAQVERTRHGALETLERATRKAVETLRSELNRAEGHLALIRREKLK